MEQQKEIKKLNSIINTDNIINKERAELIEQQRKEIEALREENFDTVYIQAIANYKNKIKEILGIEGNTDIEFYLKHLVAENNRLEDIEDGKVQVVVDNIEKKRDKYWRDKIKAKIKELEEMRLTEGDIFFQMRDYAVLILRELGVVK